MVPDRTEFLNNYYSAQIHLSASELVPALIRFAEEVWHELYSHSIGYSP